MWCSGENRSGQLGNGGMSTIRSRCSPAVPSASTDAKTAGTLDAFHAANDREDRDRALSYVAFGAGAGLIGYAIFRWVSAPSASSTEVALTPTDGGSTLWIRGSR